MVTLEDAVDMKLCTKCGKLKRKSEFTKDRSKSDGLRCGCKECSRAYVSANREAETARQKEWRAKNPDKAKVLQKRNRMSVEYHREWRAKNKDRCAMYREKQKIKRLNGGEVE